MGDPRLSKEFEDTDQDPEDRDGPTERSAQSCEKGVVATNESDFELIEGSSNVFRDFDDPRADPNHAKAPLEARIIAVLNTSEISVRRAAALTCFAVSRLTRVPNADPARFALNRLIKLHTAVDGTSRVMLHVGPLRIGEALVTAPTKRTSMHSSDDMLLS